MNQKKAAVAQQKALMKQNRIRRNIFNRVKSNKE